MRSWKWTWTTRPERQQVRPRYMYRIVLARGVLAEGSRAEPWVVPTCLDLQGSDGWSEAKSTADGPTAEANLEEACAKE